MTGTDAYELARRNMRRAIASAVGGVIPQVMVKDSSVIIIFASIIGASEMVSVMSTSLQDLATCFLMLPFALLSNRVGVKRQIIIAVIISVVALMLTAAAPWFGAGASMVMMLSLCAFAVSISAYIAAWFPLVDAIVPPDERGLFFGRLNFLWQLVAALFIFGSGCYIGRFATVERLQIIICVAALVSLGRAWYISKIVLPPADPCVINFRAGILDIIRNKALTGFSVYLFFLYMAANATMPIVFVFARNYLKLPDNVIVNLSAVTMIGLIAGFFVGGRVVHRYGVKSVFLWGHIGFALLNFSLLLVRSGSISSVILLGTILGTYGAIVACASIAVSSELLALAPANNKAVSIAFGYSLYAAGLGGSRALASLVLGSGILAQNWSFAGAPMTHYHSMFLCFGFGVIMAMFLLVLVPAMTRTVEKLPV